ncbi:MAG: ATP-binding cassette domain-containing protein [Geminicoccaceae bacterium]
MSWEFDPKAPPESRLPQIEVEGLKMAFGSRVLMDGLTFTIRRGDIFIIMGGSGSGKSTLLRCIVGLQRPAAGTIRMEGEDVWDADPEEQARIQRRFGIMYQQGALWTSMTLAENVALPLQTYTDLTPEAIAELAEYKLALVGLAGFGGYSPAEISGGMRKRAAIARAMALDPEVLFLDEPGAGLDPITSRLLDDLILALRQALGMTVVIVTHELASIFAVGDNSVFLDAETRTMIAHGNPSWLVEHTDQPKLRAFLTRGAKETAP